MAGHLAEPTEDFGGGSLRDLDSSLLYFPEFLPPVALCQQNEANKQKMLKIHDVF